MNDESRSLETKKFRRKRHDQQGADKVNDSDTLNTILNTQTIQLRTMNYEKQKLAKKQAAKGSMPHLELDNGNQNLQLNVKAFKRTKSTLPRNMEYYVNKRRLMKKGQSNNIDTKQLMVIGR